MTFAPRPILFDRLDPFTFYLARSVSRENPLLAAKNRAPQPLPAALSSASVHRAVPAPSPHRLRGTRRAFFFPSRSRPPPPAEPTRRPKPSLALSQAARRLHLRAAAHLHRPAAHGSTPLSILKQTAARISCSHALLLDAHGCRRPAGRLLRPSGTRLFAHHPLILRAMAQRPTIVEAARRRIALSHRPRLR